MRICPAAAPQPTLHLLPLEKRWQFKQKRVLLTPSSAQPQDPAQNPLATLLVIVMAHIVAMPSPPTTPLNALAFSPARLLAVAQRRRSSCLTGGRRCSNVLRSGPGCPSSRCCCPSSRCFMTPATPIMNVSLRRTLQAADKHTPVLGICRKLILPFLEVFESAANRQFTPIVSTVEFTRLKRTLRRRDVLLLALPYCSKCA